MHCWKAREQKALWGCAEACRGGLLFMLFLLLSPRPPQWISHGPTLGPALESVIPPFCQLMLHCSAERQNAFLLLLFPFFHPSHLSRCFFSPPPPPHPFCSSLSSRTMRTLSMRSRLAARRPARKKWQLRMTVTWSPMKPRRWWQVNSFPRLPKPLFFLKKSPFDCAA